MKVKIENWNGHVIRFVEKELGDWWAIAVDVCSALDIKNVSLAVNGNKTRRKNGNGSRGLSENQKGICEVNTLGGKQEMLCVNEAGIYKLIFRSRKPEAETFQDWIFSVIKTLRQSTGLEGFQIFRMLDKDHQREAMDKLKEGLGQTSKVDYIKANTIANKAVSSMHGYPKMLKKGDMSPEMLAHRQKILDDTVNLMTAKESFGLVLSVSKTVYGKYIS